MKKILRAVVAAWGAKRIGGGKCGCIGVIIVFLVLYYVLGYII